MGAVTVALDPFGDVRIRIEDREASQATRRKMVAIGTPVTAIVAMIATIIAAYLSVKSARNQTVAVTSDVICISELEFAQSSELAIQLGYRAIKVSRARDGDIRSIAYASSYESDVSTADFETRLFAAGTQCLEESGVRFGTASMISAQDSRATKLLRRLPREGTKPAADKDLANLSAIIKQIASSSSISIGGC